jgi:hypothetical protein
MAQSISIKRKKELENKMVVVFEDDMKSVPVGLRRIMACDLVSAFESRLCALNRSQSNLRFLAITDGGVQVATI